MNYILTSSYFDDWLDDLKDVEGQKAIARRIKLAESGNFGDCKTLEDGVCEMRIHYDPGYRLYYYQRGERIYFLLIGGLKCDQSRDIKHAKEIKKEAERSKDGDI